MARLGTSLAVYFILFVVCTSLSSLVDSLSLPQINLSRLKTTTDSSSPNATTKSSKDDSGIAIYRLFNTDTDTTCLLLKTDAVVEVNFKLHGLDEQADSFIPENAMVQGNCLKEDVATMILGWPGYSLSLKFLKTPGGEHWYLSYVKLTVSVDVPHFHGIRTKDKTIKLYSTNMVLPTPVGKSYLCAEVDIPLQTDKLDHPPKDVHGTLLLRALQVQAFMYKSENFSTPFECKSQTSFRIFSIGYKPAPINPGPTTTIGLYPRSEAAPIAVGSTLAIAALATVTGYGVFRYFKVPSKKKELAKQVTEFDGKINLDKD